jgi:hypothetical protein
MSLLWGMARAFSEGFAEGWRKNFQPFNWRAFLQGVFDAGLIIIVWEVFNGRLP